LLRFHTNELADFLKDISLITPNMDVTLLMVTSPYQYDGRKEGMKEKEQLIVLYFSKLCRRSYSISGNVLNVMHVICIRSFPNSTVIVPITPLNVSLHYLVSLMYGKLSHS